MKRYINASTELRSVTFDDNTTFFLKRGQSVNSDKAVKRVEEGIKVKDAKTTKRSTPVDQDINE